MLQCLFTIMAGLLALPGPGLPSHFPVFEGEQWLYTPGHFHGGLQLQEQLRFLTRIPFRRQTSACRIPFRLQK